MTTVPCPRCGMPVDLEQEVCSHCRTPRDDKEIEEGHAFVRAEETRRKRRPRLIAAGAAAVALLTAGWLLRGLVLGPILVAWSDFRMEVERTRQPSHWLKGKPPLVASAVPGFPGAAAARHAAPNSSGAVAVSSFVYLTESAPYDSAAAPPAAAAEPSRTAAVTPTPIAPSEEPSDAQYPLGPGELRVQGMVYDLSTGHPIGGVKVRFQHRDNGATWEATTSPAGRYRVGLYKNATDRVFVMIEAPGYRKGLLEDQDPPYRERSSEARAGVIAETTESDLEPVPLRHRESASIVDLDLVLVPEGKKPHE